MTRPACRPKIFQTPSTLISGSPLRSISWPREPAVAAPAVTALPRPLPYSDPGKTPRSALPVRSAGSRSRAAFDPRLVRALDMRNISRIPVAAEDAASLAEKAYFAIRDLIVSLELPPGSVLNQPELIDRLGIGRTPVREALRRLAQEQLV